MAHATLLPKFRAISTSGGMNVADRTVAKPTGTAQGDMMVAVINIKDNANAALGNMTPPAGWDLRAQVSHSSGNFLQVFVYTKEAGPSEPANYTWTCDRNSDWNNSILSYENGAIFDVVATDFFAGGTAASSVLPTVTPTADGALLLRICAIQTNSPSWVLSTTRLTTRVGNVLNGVASGIAERIHDSGATGTDTFSHVTSQRRVVSLALIPKLPPGQFLAVRRIATNNDDGRVTGSAWTATGSQENTGNSGGTIFQTWFRYAALNIPAGAKVLGAYMETFGAGTFSGALTKVRAEAADNPSHPTSVADYNARVKTTAGVDWDPGAGTSSSVHESPDIKDVIQEVVDRGGWAAGNALQLFLLDDGSPSGGLFLKRMADQNVILTTSALYVHYSVGSGAATGWGIPAGIS